MTNRKGIAVGLLRPPSVFFYEVDQKSVFRKLVKLCENHLKFFSIFETKRGYHVIGYPFRSKIWRIFKKALPTDFTLRLHKRWNRKQPQVLRIGSKFTDDNFGRVYSQKPKKIMGNFELVNYDRWMVLYRTLH